ncbi:MAG: class II aldolase/adducin family protein, partial [SAR324 cluster bacterium]|nr:class II aldolase/adducin family protein [SAR324 cluster bacterium]
MKNLWDPKEASQFEENSLQMRVYSSRLLGNNSDLVLHGGGNTSVKFQETNLFGEVEEILYVKGSGYNLATIEKNGFTPLRLKTLRKLVEVENLSDAEMVRQQQMAMTNPDAPIPSVEALLHAVIPFKWIDHTHADAVVTITNTPSGKELIQEIYGERLFIIPYVMPGFKLVHKVNELARNVDWNKYEGMVLLNHGIFSFAESVLESYTRMIDLVSLAEKYLEKNSTISSTLTQDSVPGEAFFTEHPTLQTLARIRRKVSEIRGSAMLAQLNYGPEARSLSNLPNVKEIATRGPITSDHLIRTKP